MHMLVVSQLLKYFTGLGSDLFTPEREIPQDVLSRSVLTPPIFKSLHLDDHCGTHPIHSVNGNTIPDLVKKRTADY